MSTPSPLADREGADSLLYEALVTSIRGTIRGSETSYALILASVSVLATVQARLGFGPSAALVDSLAQRFRRALSSRGSVLKLGDSSICVRVSSIRNSGHALLAGERLKHETEEAMAQAQLAIAPELHFGIALCPLHARDAETLVRKAQLAAAAARARGQTLLVYDESCAQQVLRPWTLGDRFVEALRSGALDVHYQPKVRLTDRSTAGVEALLRWLQDGRPVSTPDTFIPLAEQAGLIPEATWYVLSNALRQVGCTPPLPVAVNVNPTMLHHADFMEVVRTAVSNWNAAGRTHPRDHGRSADRRPRAGHRQNRATATVGREDRHRRLRHRLFLAELLQEGSGR